MYSDSTFVIVDDGCCVVVRSHSGRVNSLGLMMILYISPRPVFWMMEVSSWWLIFPNPLGIHNAGCSYVSSLIIVIVARFAFFARFICIVDMNWNQFFVWGTLR